MGSLASMFDRQLEPALLSALVTEPHIYDEDLPEILLLLCSCIISSDFASCGQRLMLLPVRRKGMTASEDSS